MKIKIHCYLQRFKYLFLHPIFPRLTLSVVIVSDIVLCFISIYAAILLRTGRWETLPPDQILLPALVSIMLLIPIMTSLGVYGAIIRHFGLWLVGRIYIVAVLYSVLFTAIIIGLDLLSVPRTIGLIQAPILFGGLLGIRFFFKAAFSLAEQVGAAGAPLNQVLIYGAGKAGIKLADVVRDNLDYRLVGFIDDDPSLQFRSLSNTPVFPPDQLDILKRSKNVTHCFLAVPSASAKRRLEILEKLARSELRVFTFPRLAHLTIAKSPGDFIRELELDELLGREIVEPNEEILSARVLGKTVLVTGGGGSIGSELARQISKLKPDRIILLDACEFNLFTIEQELNTIFTNDGSENNVDLVPILGTIQNKAFINNVMGFFKPDVVYHAAAYKHVPLIEKNFIEAVKNNIFGTLSVVSSAIDNGVSDFVLISTDKAVRPTNLMGATKRVCELIIQAYASDLAVKTRLSLVRFGNVLASSGSVIPTFRDQIRQGGPVTVTHSEITRFFMTVTEAAQLVLQASSLADGGDVFILDMGDPVKVLDLAERMIRLSGLSVLSSENPNGIEIREVGLRPGEKLFEETLIVDSAIPTTHPKIFKAYEEFFDLSFLSAEINNMEDAIEKNDAATLYICLKRLVPELCHTGKIIQ